MVGGGGKGTTCMTSTCMLHASGLASMGSFKVCILRLGGGVGVSHLPFGAAPYNYIGFEKKKPNVVLLPGKLLQSTPKLINA